MADEDGVSQPATGVEFDEAWYLAKYEDVALAVARGEWSSGYVHYCSVGRSRGRIGAPPIDHQSHGCIDFFGYCESVSGFIVGGWVSSSLASQLPIGAGDFIATFEGEGWHRSGFVTYYRLDRVSSFGVGFIVFFALSEAPSAKLLSLTAIDGKGRFVLTSGRNAQKLVGPTLIGYLERVASGAIGALPDQLVRIVAPKREREKGWIEVLGYDASLGWLVVGWVPSAVYVDAPVHTLCRFGEHEAVVEPTLVKFSRSDIPSEAVGIIVLIPPLELTDTEIREIQLIASSRSAILLPVTDATVLAGQQLRKAVLRALDAADDTPKASYLGRRLRSQQTVAGRNVADLPMSADGVEPSGSPTRVDPVQFGGALRIEDGCARGWVSDAFNGVLTPVVTFQDQDGRLLGEVLPELDASQSCGQGRFDFPLPAQCYGRRERVVRALVGNREIARAQCDLRLDGYLDVLSADRCAGWVFSPDAPGTRLQIEIVRDGSVVGRGRCDLPRPDLRELYPLTWRSGFDIRTSPGRDQLGPSQVSIRLENSDVELFEGPFIVGRRAGIIQAAQAAGHIVNENGVGLSEVGRALLRAALSRFCSAQRQGGDYVRLNGVSLAGKATTTRRLNIVIPVYLGVASTKDCIDSVIRHRRAGADGIILVNDCSPEPAMAELLQTYLCHPDVYLLSNKQNLGFVRSVNRALEFCKDGDVVLLNSDTTVFEGCFDELFKVAQSAGDIATVTAISNNATIFTYPHPRLATPRLKDITWAELASTALHENAGLTVDVPTGHGFCLLLKRAVVDRLGPFDEIFGRGYGEENEWCCRAADLGYRHVAAAGVFVEHRESVSFGSQKDGLVEAHLKQLSKMFPEYLPIIMDWQRGDDLRRVRWALDGHRLARACDAGASFALVVENWLGGGTATAVADLEHAVGYGGARKLSLTSTEDDQLILAAADPVVRAVFQPGDVEALFALLERVTVSLVMVHQLLGFSREFIERLGLYAQSRRSCYYLHDFYSLCPRVTMVNAIGEFCNGADASVCERCIELAGAHEGSRLQSLTPGAHRALLGDFMRRMRHVVAPSQDTVAHVNAIFADVPIAAIPHPQTFTGFQRGTATGSFNNVVLLGAIGPQKGSATLLEIARRARLLHPQLTFHVVGHTDLDSQLRAIGNVLITGPYNPDDLPGLIAAAAGRLALFLHGWPETFSYTLSEAVAHGLIPLVPDIGAPAARVRAADFGVVFPFPIDAAAVLDLVQRVAAGEAGFGQGDPTAFETASSVVAIRDLVSASDRAKGAELDHVDDRKSEKPRGSRPFKGQPIAKAHPTDSL